MLRTRVTPATSGSAVRFAANAESRGGEAMEKFAPTEGRACRFWGASCEDDGQGDKEDVDPWPVLNPGLPRRVISEGLHDRHARRAPRGPDARERHENHGQDRHDDNRGWREDDDLVTRRGRGAEWTHETEQETTQAHSRDEAHDRGNRSPERRFNEKQIDELSGGRAARLEDRQLPPPFGVAQVHPDCSEVDAEQQDRRRQREVDDPLNRDHGGEVTDGARDVVERHLALERYEDLVDLAVEPREVPLGRREVVRIEKAIPIDSDFTLDGIPAV